MRRICMMQVLPTSVCGGGEGSNSVGAKSGAKLNRTEQDNTGRYGSPGRWRESARNTELNTTQQHDLIHARAYFKTGALNHSIES
jgi:hypothetical protein